MPDHIRKGLSRKILVVLFLSVAMVMVAVIYLTVSHETEQMLNEMAAGSEETTSAIYAGIKYPMAVGDSGAVERQLLDIRNQIKDIEVFICGTDQKIIFSSHENRVKSYMKDHIRDARILKALSLSLESGQHPVQAFEERAADHRFLTHIHTILNQEECFGCHGREKKVLGAIVMRNSTDGHYAAISGLRNANILISVVGICAIIFVSHLLMVKLVSKPIEGLAREIRGLPEEIDRGAPLLVPEIRRKDEIGMLQDTFHQMAVELDGKTRAIERSKAELTKANKELEAFAYSVSHDLRAPLRNIDGFSKILLDDFSGSLDEKGRHYLRRVREGTLRMSLLIDDILALSRIGRAELQLRPVDCARIINGALEYFAKEIEGRGVAVSVQRMPLLNCDSTLMQQLFTNLISNALKFTRGVGKPEIVIGHDRQRGALFVKDNGIGFDMQYHDKIFRVFERLHLPEEYEGTGIGLAIVARVAERHKGRVWAESIQGEGATFYIELPAHKK